jgi:hypothetical protein
MDTEILPSGCSRALSFYGLPHIALLPSRFAAAPVRFIAMTH